MRQFSWIIGACVLTIALGLIGLPRVSQKNVGVDKAGSPGAERQGSGKTSQEPNRVTKAKIREAYAQLPLHFEPNHGQTHGQVKVLARGRGYTLFLTATEAMLVLVMPEQKSGDDRQKAKSMVETSKMIGTIILSLKRRRSSIVFLRAHGLIL